LLPLATVNERVGLLSAFDGFEHKMNMEMAYS